MKIDIDCFMNLGSHEDERILFNVTEDCNLGSFLIAMSKKVSDTSISSKLENVFWLRDAELKRGDLVVVYTTRSGNGMPVIENPSGSHTYFLFWNLPELLSTCQNKKVVCFEATWRAKEINVSTPTIEESSQEGN